MWVTIAGGARLIVIKGVLVRILSYFLYGAVIGLAVGYWLQPKIASKVSSEATSKVEYRVVTQEKIIEKPGGVREIVRTVTDNSVRNDASKATSVQIKQPDWMLSLAAGIQRPSDFRPEYTLTAQRRIFGPAFIGAYGRTDGEFGLSIALEF